ncbi:spermidine/putrescine ABC transporter ATP-binding protein [Virgibacillus profundi]|uniref:Spermidine/putrescine ABC transporter ATP-binding protein n=1 Tax=Virgibacillus profundi TaxID=2024555 RepID=A0A2A2I8V8_9BACI|nr:ABC transporter ATP-binding protein [Virgibacillus profundi]PAV27724.1 spermidine/putrescine ABC transporter ATP-binding protein [Virgibacillus profundi]PXY51879.1 ABC transporter ATP-binding protein [Virgibacillus profundi]
MSFLTLDHVSHHYFSKSGYTKALDNISLSIKEGEFIALLGPSGCGKSTILSIIAGIMKQTAGKVLLQDKTISDSDLAIGYMLQQDYLFPWKTIIDNVMLGPKICKTNSVKTKEKAMDLLDEVGLCDVADAYPSSLSGGMRQRVALVRTLINDPKVLLLDEPFSALDYQTKLKLEDLVSQLLKTYYKTTILVTHDIGEAIAMSDRIYIMDANPGSIAKVFEVPLELRNETPFLVRRHPKYQLIFDKVWEELDKKAQEGGALK